MVPIPQVPAVNKSGEPVYAEDNVTQKTMPDPKIIAYFKSIKEYETEALNQGVPIKRAGLQSNLPAAEQAPTGKTSAPQSAIDFLKNNNTPEMKKAFKNKYGYLP
jgi:O-glycosyl hydrolase